MNLEPPIGGNLRNHLQGILPRGIEGKAETPKAKWGFPDDPRIWRHKKNDEAGNRRPFHSLFLGYDQGKNITWDDDRHVLTCAGSRSGKGVSLIIPNLFTYEGSVLVIDPKGENTRKTMHRRIDLGQDVVILDPFNTTGFYGKDSKNQSMGYNPLDLIDPEDEEQALSIAGNIASSLIIPDRKQPYFTDMARAFLKALILLVKMPPFGEAPLFAEHEQNLVTVRALSAFKHPCLEGDKAFSTEPKTALLNFMVANGKKHFKGIVASVANQYKGNDSDGALSIFSTLEQQLDFIDDMPPHVLESSGFSFANMKATPTSLFLCLPANKMDTHARWLRMLISTALSDYVTAHDTITQQGGLSLPVLMVLDEFPVLGHMGDIKTAAGFIAGYGVKLWFIVQNIGQLEDHYGKSWETLIGNCGMRLFFGNSEPSSLDYISKALGRVGMTVEEMRRSGGGAAHSTGYSLREEYRLEGLLSADEIDQIFRREARLILVMAAGFAPVILERIIYFANEDYFKQFDNGVL